MADCHSQIVENVKSRICLTFGMSREIGMLRFCSVVPYIFVPICTRPEGRLTSADKVFKLGYPLKFLQRGWTKAKGKTMTMTIAQLAQLLSMGLTVEQVEALQTMSMSTARESAAPAKPVTMRLAKGSTIRPAQTVRQSRPRDIGALAHYAINGKTPTVNQLGALFPAVRMTGNVARVAAMIVKAGKRGVTVRHMRDALGLSDKAVQSAVWWLRNHDIEGRRLSKAEGPRAIVGKA